MVDHELKKANNIPENVQVEIKLEGKSAAFAVSFISAVFGACYITHEVLNSRR